MVDTIKTQNGEINVITGDGVEHLHNLLSENYELLGEMDPVEPPGIKDESLLESAVYRQYTGSGNWYKYDNCHSNCATLVYGVIKNHSFHNGNKRAGLLCLIKHLYINGYVLKPSIGHKEIYDLVLAIADNSLIKFTNRYKEYRRYMRRNKLNKRKKLNTDQEIELIAHWIKRNSISKKTTLKGTVKINKLKSLLESKGIKLEQNGAKIIVYKEEESRLLGVRVSTKRVNEKQYSLGTSKTEIGGPTLNYLRRDFNLKISDGVDNISFYDDNSFMDEEIKAYKSIIYRLSKT